jgi:Uma2 family endonuclease
MGLDAGDLHDASSSLMPPRLWSIERSAAPGVMTSRYDLLERVSGRHSMAITPERMTLDQFLALPEKEPPLELFGGEVTQKVSPKMFQSAIQSFLISLFNAFCRPKRLGRAFSELRTEYAGISTVPDLVYFVWDRIPRSPSGKRLAEAMIPPDIAVEIVSPDQSVTDLLIRCLWYVANGVRIALLIDPDRLSVVLFRPGAEPIALRDTGSLDLTDVIPGFSIDVAELFAELDVD